MRSIGKECVSTVQTLALPFGEFPRQMLVSVTPDQLSVGDLGSAQAGLHQELVLGLLCPTGVFVDDVAGEVVVLPVVAVEVDEDLWVGGVGRNIHHATAPRSNRARKRSRLSLDSRLSMTRLSRRSRFL
jgi:hypothetical protein